MCYTSFMPTARPRHMITETDEVARALHDAARRWPDDRERPTRLLLDLVREGHRAIAATVERATADRRAAIERTGGVLTGSYPPAHLDERDAHHAAATERLLALADRPFGASSITLAEALVAPTRVGRLPAARAALDALEVSELSLPPHAAERLAALRVETALKLPDCCVLLAAEAVRGAILTFDERLAREAASRGLAA